jgi:hypothetical protein
MSGTPSLPDGSTYRCSSLTSLHLQAKGSEYSFTTRRRVAERNSPNKRRAVRVRNSSSGPCVPNPSIEPKPKLFAQAFHAAAKVIHRGLRGAKTGRSSPSMNNFGWTISAPVLRLSQNISVETGFWWDPARRRGLRYGLIPDFGVNLGWKESASRVGLV